MAPTFSPSDTDYDEVNEAAAHDRATLPVLIDNDGVTPLLFRCDTCSGWQDAIKDVTYGYEEYDYVFMLRCGHTYYGNVEEN